MNGEDAAEEALLLNRAAGGDMDAWGALLALHQERLQSWLLSGSTRACAGASMRPT